jgi:ATP-dependent Lhr-like helicase
MDRQAVSDLVDFMLRSGVLWSDDGVLSFAPEGEAKYGRKNFMELLSVFTSPPLFRVLAGQKELGYVHESTFYKRDEGPPILVLAGRSWKTNHLDWKRRIAHVEPAEERGRSRWLGEGQFLSHRVCQRIRRLLADDAEQPIWSQRATAQINEIRTEYPWASAEATSIVRHPSGEVRWWTFGGGVANTLLADHLRPKAEVRVDNLSLRFTTSMKLNEVEELIGTLSADRIEPVPAEDAIEGMKFSECLPPPVAAEVFSARFNDAEAVRTILDEPRRVVVEN